MSLDGYPLSSLLIFQGVLHRFANLGIQDDLIIDSGKTRAVALACKMVGGGSDGSLDLCARVCIIDEYENILFHSYIKPQLPVTNYRCLLNFMVYFSTI